jgi:hypothetical protein
MVQPIKGLRNTVVNSLALTLLGHPVRKNAAESPVPESHPEPIHALPATIDQNGTYQ